MLRKLKKTRVPTEGGTPSTIALPGALNAQVALLDRVRTWRTVASGLFVLLTVQSLGFYGLMSHKLFAQSDKDWLIVPGATEITRIRPGQIPWVTVVQQGEYFAHTFGNMRYDTVEFVYQQLERYMSPEVAHEFRNSWVSSLEKWKKTQYKRSFTFNPVSEFYLIDGRYHILVKGVLSERSLSHLTGMEEVKPDTTAYVHIVMSTRKTLDTSTMAALALESINFITEREYATKNNDFRSNVRRAADHK